MFQLWHLQAYTKDGHHGYGDSIAISTASTVDLELEVEMLAWIEQGLAEVEEGLA